LADDVVIVTPSDASTHELSVARSLRDNLADWFGFTLTIGASAPPGKRAIVLGTSERPVIRSAIAAAGAHAVENSAPEAYLLCVRLDLALVSGADSRGVRHGFQSLKQLINYEDGKLCLPCLDVSDRPLKPFRGFKLYLPGPQNIVFFKRFIRDFV